MEAIASHNAAQARKLARIHMEHSEMKKEMEEWNGQKWRIKENGMDHGKRQWNGRMETWKKEGMDN